MANVIFQDPERISIIEQIMEAWCEDYTENERVQVETVLQRQLEGYPTHMLEATLTDIQSTA